MTLKSRLRLFAGILGIFALVAVLTVVFNQRQSQVGSHSATIQAESYQIGTDYGGIVLERLVDEGEEIQEGEPILRVQSPSLEADLAEGLLQPSTIAYQVDESGVITLAAPVTGYVTEINAERGSFVQAGQVLAEVARAGSLFVEGEFSLTPRDYGRVENGNAVRVILPNNTIIDGTVTDVEVHPVDGQAETTVTISSPSLVEGSHDGLARQGTPVNVTLELRDDGPLAGVSDELFDLLRTIGL